MLAAPLLAADDVRLTGLQIKAGNEKSVAADGKISLTNGILEFLAVEVGGRDYESLVALDCKPSALKFALLLIGCQDGETNGTPLRIDLEWQADGKTKRTPVEALMIDRQSGKAPEALPFFFSGSFFGPDLFTTNQIFHADVEQAHVALWWQPSVLVNIRDDHGNPYKGDDQGFMVDSQAVPKLGTPVKLIFRPREKPVRPDSGSQK